jgi:3-isopropylmalate/(R)-2-methylmalate dehydratase small subunit
LPIMLSEEQVEGLFQRTNAKEGYKLKVDLVNKVISDDDGLSISFDLDEHRRQFLLQGLDDIGLTLMHEPKITAYEAKQAASVNA